MYYVLIDKAPGQPWAAQFSDGDIESVEFEFEDRYYSDRRNGYVLRYKIVAIPDDRQETIDAVLAKFNAKGV